MLLLLLLPMLMHIPWMAPRLSRRHKPPTSLLSLCTRICQVAPLSTSRAGPSHIQLVLPLSLVGIFDTISFQVFVHAGAIVHQVYVK
jgi:hypothetical protein